MRCPYCKQDDDRVIDSRTVNEGLAIRRRRECNGCTRRFTTYERLETVPLRVVKKDGTRVPFDRDKIRAGILIACEKRPVAMEAIEGMVDGIEAALYDTYEKEVPSQYIGERVMSALRKLDEVAYVRFASVYREFKDATEFMNEIQQLD